MEEQQEVPLLGGHRQLYLSLVLCSLSASLCLVPSPVSTLCLVPCLSAPCPCSASASVLCLVLPLNWLRLGSHPVCVCDVSLGVCYLLNGKQQAH